MIQTSIPRYLQWGTYPLLLTINLTVVTWDVMTNNSGRFAGALVTLNALSLLLLEYFYPMQMRWRMTWHTAKRDLFFMACGIVMIIFSNWALTYLAIAIAPTEGWLNDIPVITATIIAMVIVQFFQYWLHRFMHEGRGKLGKFFWKVHRPHHILERVYVLMHARFHPIDAFFTRAVFIFPLTWLGISADALYAMTIIVGLQGLIGHLNVDLRAGYLNYLVTGTELHRFHHSADVQEGKNYGAFLPLFDLLFGTFVYHPAQAPKELGVSPTDQGPNSDATIAHIIYPFKKLN